LARNGSINGCSFTLLARQENVLPPHSQMIHQPSGGAQGVATDMENNLRNVKLKTNYTNNLKPFWSNF
jgi:ATP-dependent protease ClpP protease subunit